MTKLFVSYEIALKLKEKGFNEKCIAFYKGKYVGDGLHAIGQHEGCSIHGDNYDSGWNLEYPPILAPLYQQVIDWFREKHGICISIYTSSTGFMPEFDYLNKKYFGKVAAIEFASLDYYETLNKAIEEALKLI